MKKVCGFHLPLHLKELRRRVKRSCDLAALGLEEEAAFSALLDELGAELRPAVLFDSFSADAPQAAGLSSLPGLARTLVLGTLGPAVDPFLEKARALDEGRGRLVDSILQLALGELTHFVTDLIEDEVAAERCELSPVEHLNSPQALAALLERLEGSKIGLRLESGRLVPAYSSAFCLSWVPLPRGKTKAAGLSAASPRPQR